MDALREFGYGLSLGPFPIVVWFGFASFALFLVAATVAGLKKQVSAFRKVSVRAHRAMAGIAILLAVVHLVLALTTYI